MESSKEKSSGGSKSNLNESTLPLLDELDNKSAKEKIEMETKETDNGETKEPAKEEDGKKTKKGHSRTVSCADTLTVGVNLMDRDEKGVNQHVNLTFEDVLAEPDSSQGLSGSWKLSYAVFSGTRLWVYRLVTALLALPCGLAWGLVFSLLTILHVWFFTPLLKTMDLGLHVVRRVWGGVVHTLLDPVFQSASLLLGGVRVTKSDVITVSDKVDHHI